MKIRLLNDGGYPRLKAIDLPVIVEALRITPSGRLAVVTAAELRKTGAQTSGAAYPFEIGTECELVPEVLTFWQKLKQFFNIGEA
ncbi:MAG: hypothetical protein V3S69_02550 [Dehalococcoidales bacterium]